jgi:biotin carboxyl carrier protein
VKNGDEVKLGDKLIMYEAMKMENTVAAEKDGVIQNILVQAGDTVLQDAKIMEIV